MPRRWAGRALLEREGEGAWERDWGWESREGRREEEGVAREVKERRGEVMVDILGVGKWTGIL